MALDTYTPLSFDLGAVNRLLQAIGESPLAALGSGSPDEVAAQNTLEDVYREVQKMDWWRFNSSFGVELSPHDTYDWTDSGGATETLNIFTLGGSPLRWRVTPAANQTDLTLSVRDTVRYTPIVAALVDTLRNRDGLPASRHPYLYVDHQMYRKWSEVPDSVRDFTVLRAIGRFVREQLDGGGQPPGWLKQDEQDAYRTLLRDQRVRPAPNVFDNPEHWATRGQRAGNPYRSIRQVYSQ